MNYSNSIKAILLAAINDLAKEPEKYAVNPGVDFIRNRKLGFKDYLLQNSRWSFLYLFENK